MMIKECSISLEAASLSDKTRRLEKVKAIAEACTNCSLGSTRKKLVFGEGNVDCKLMFIAEAPGRTEDLRGRPLIGRAGTLLRKMIQAIEIDVGTVYLANICKCRPPNNRPPESEEIESCIKFLNKQIEIINPKMIVLLGRTAVKAILPEYKTTALDALRDISKIGSTVYKNIPVLVTYHPSALLREPFRKVKAKEDFIYLQGKYHNL